MPVRLAPSSESFVPPPASRPQPFSPPSSARNGASRRSIVVMNAAPAIEKSPTSARYGALAVVDALDGLRHHAVDVEIALAVAVRAQVQRHAVEDRREVGAVIEVEAAQEILVRLAAAGVLHGDHARHGFEQLGDAQHRPHEQVGAADGALARCLGRADELEAAAEHDDLFEASPCARRRRLCGAAGGWVLLAEGDRGRQRQTTAVAKVETRGIAVRADDIDRGLVLDVRGARNGGEPRRPVTQLTVGLTANALR